ncbi:MAG TPA: tryptophan synthase subunit alpha [Vicinamibacterales bacterium]|nr:tryptophan synthase subunit alpha [Vicinamibacterales bacterium]
MSRIDAAFRDLRKDGRPGLVTYVTAGDPDLERSREILMRLDRAGADILEVGVPFSDPLADGPVIQRATERAIAAGSTLVKALAMVSDVRALVNAPIVIFSYANPILRMGVDEFVSRARQAGVDGVLTLDVPPEESEQFRAALSRARIDTIFLLSPTTSADRIRRAAALGTGFLYGISRVGVTGIRDDIADSARELAARVRHETAMPLAVGFGLSRPEHVRAVAAFADAAVVGSALVNVIAEHGQSPRLLDEVERYVRWLKS